MKINLKSLLRLRNLLILVILLLALFVRIYRAGPLLGFYFDQGRDAMVIWKLWHQGKAFLVGPVSGLEGIFLGPFYYYLIAPFYLFGKGDPVYPAVFLGFLSTLALFFLYRLGNKMHSREAGIFSLIVGGFSFYIVLSSRWLANPTPILLTSVVILWSMWEIVQRQKNFWWLVISLMVGLSFQFESASAIFYLPMVLIFALWQARSVGRQGKTLACKKFAVASAFIFILTLIPQIIFNFRHQNILFNNFSKNFLNGNGFSHKFWEVLALRANYFWTAGASKIFPQPGIIAAISLILVGVALVMARKRLKKALALFVIFLGTPVIGITLFQGNSGNIYDYYLTGYYLPFILLFSVGLAEVWRWRLGKPLVVLFFVLFLNRNAVLLKNYIVSGVDGDTHVSMGNELQAVDWVFKDAKSRNQSFNVDIYVPPVIPHSYDYLFLWQGTKRCGKGLCGMEGENRVKLLYTLYEVDPPHPERLSAWLNRQKGIGIVENEEKFGGVVVQRRKRI